MRTTTIGDLSDAITARIRQIAPSATMHSSKGWRPVDDLDAVQSGEVRTFYVDVPPEENGPVPDGIYSPASIEHACTVLVWTSYGSIKRAQHRRLCPDDARDIMLDIAIRSDDSTSNTIAGLVSFEHTGWQSTDDEQGRYYGAHVFAVRYLAPGIPGAT